METRKAILEEHVSRYSVTPDDFKAFKDWVRYVKHITYLSLDKYTLELFLEWRAYRRRYLSREKKNGDKR